MMFFLIGGIVGFVGGFSSLSNGWFFKRTIVGNMIPGIAFFTEIGLGVYSWYCSGLLIGLAVFLFSWLAGGWLGMKVATL